MRSHIEIGFENFRKYEYLKPIELRNITKSFDGEAILRGIDLDISDGEFVTFLGPSGCGKTTTLRIIAGFIEPETGDVFFDSKRINDVPPHKREVNTIFQIERRVNEMLTMVNLEGFGHRSIAKLSGGQQQRVAIARALINHPKVLLLDEPLAALDLKLRKDMQKELKNIQKALGITFIFVTHDQEEALSMSDTVVVMDAGKIQQIGSPTDIYNEPVNAFVADFIGESNIIDGVMLADYKVRLAGHTFQCLDSGFNKNEPVDVVIRPEDVDIVPVEKGMLTGIVTSVTFLGVHYEIIVDICGFKWMIQTTDYCGEGETVGLSIDPDAIHIMKKSEYSGMFGDYSSFSDEIDTMSELPEDEEDE